jgi:hypothetical protein
MRNPPHDVKRLLVGDQVQALHERGKTMTTASITHRQSEQTPISVHVVPIEIEDKRLHALLARYLEVINAGEHPPLWYVNQVLSEISAIRLARRAEGGA